MQSVELAVAHGGTSDAPTALVQLSRCGNPPLEVAVLAEWMVDGATVTEELVDHIREVTAMAVLRLIQHEFVIQPSLWACGVHLAVDCEVCGTSPF